MKHADGFTLLELMVVVVIILILTMLVYPSYQDYIIKARRLEGQVALLDAIGQQERYFSAHRAYREYSGESADPEDAPFKRWSGGSARTSAYEISAQACPGMPVAACIEVRATPGTARVDARFRDPDCGTLTLSSIGQQGAEGQGQRCWR